MLALCRPCACCRPCLSGRWISASSKNHSIDLWLCVCHRLSSHRSLSRRRLSYHPLRRLRYPPRRHRRCHLLDTLPRDRPGRHPLPPPPHHHSRQSRRPCRRRHCYLRSLHFSFHSPCWLLCASILPDVRFSTRRCGQRVLLWQRTFCVFPTCCFPCLLPSCFF